MSAKQTNNPIQETEPIKKSEPIVQKVVEETKPTVIMTELDSVIHERMKSQPVGLPEIDIAVKSVEKPGLHRISLPVFFEKYSYDCTRGDTCEAHGRGEKGEITKRGKYIFRWIMKHKRAIDEALNVRGWYLVNRTYFTDAPRHLFSVSGGVEEGDLILAFMPVEKALAIRKNPSEKSKELLRSRMTRSKKDPKRVLMTGNPDQEHIYEPQGNSDGSEEKDGQESYSPNDLVEERDF